MTARAGPETKYIIGSYPELNRSSKWIFFDRRTHSTSAKAGPYFYDIELIECSPPGSGHKGCTWHGKPNEYMWKNKDVIFDNEASALAWSRKLVKGRKTIKGGPFVQRNVSSRNCLPPAAVDAVDSTESSMLSPAAASFLSTASAEVKPAVADAVAEVKPAVGAGHTGSGFARLTRPAEYMTSSASSESTRPAKKANTAAHSTAAPSTDSTHTMDDVLAMTLTTLRDNFPFTSDLVFDATQTWNDRNHQTLSNPCKKANTNVFHHTHSVIVGANPTKPGTKNFWVIGTKEGVIIPYNLKLKLGMVRNGSKIHVCDTAEKARVAAIYRECELRGIGFKKPSTK